MQIRAATPSDAEGINHVYNHFIATSPATFDVEAKTLDDRKAWLEARPPYGPHRAFVADEDGRVLGFCGSGPFRERAAYASSVETTVYLEPEATGRGIGTALYTLLFEALSHEEIHRAYAGIVTPNPASVALHERFGFTLVGTFNEQGRKFGRFWDVAWYEKRLG